MGGWQTTMLETAEVGAEANFTVQTESPAAHFVRRPSFGAAMSARGDKPGRGLGLGEFGPTPLDALVGIPQPAIAWRKSFSSFTSQRGFPCCQP